MKSEDLIHSKKVQKELFSLKGNQQTNYWLHKMIEKLTKRKWSEKIK